MNPLLELSSHEFVKKFLAVVKEKSLAEEVSRSAYSLHYFATGSFFKVDLSDLVFIADNRYELWLAIYQYMLDYSSDSDSKTIVQFANKELGLENIRLVKKYLGIEEKREPFNMADYEELLNEFNCELEMLDDEDSFAFSMEDFVDLVVENLFTNDTFWAREIKIDEYLSDDDVEEDE